MTQAPSIKTGVDADTQIIVTRLVMGQASQEERDRALATVLMSLWKQDELRSLIKLVHNEECAMCPLKSQSKSDESTWQQVAFALLKYGGWLIAALLAIVKMKAGQ